VDHPGLDPIWEAAAVHDLGVLLHPTGGMDNPMARDYLLWLTFGWPFDTSLAMLRLVYAGVPKRYPTLRFLTHHLGAFVPAIAERIKGVNTRVERMGGGLGTPDLIAALKGFYGDTAVNGHRPALEAGYSFFGPDHILFGTDYPYVPIIPQRDAVASWELDPAERTKILEGNAKGFFKLA
jgi:aminocarboxymuconate-semialdehyde decarboxylase